MEYNFQEIEKKWQREWAEKGIYRVSNESDKPHYYVLLKDDKSYPWICITNEDYPRVFITRNKPQRGARCFGPYAHSNMAHVVIDVIRKIYPLRTCRHAIDQNTIERAKIPLCLQYHIHNCEGCCRGLVSKEQYAE